MLLHLAIKNLAIIEQTSIELGPGLNVLTGETGAGKSIIIDALSLVLGDRARTETIRRGARQAEVQALFRLPADAEVAERLRAQDLGGDEDPGPVAGATLDVVVRRIVAPNGKGRVYINGALVTVSTLAEVTRGLVDLSSQHQHTALLDASGHLDLLDRFGGLMALRARFDAAWRALVQARRERDGLSQRETARATREDFVRFQLGEIDEVNPVPGEDEELARERERLAHGERLLTGAREVESVLCGRSSAVSDQLLGALRTLDRLVTIDATLQPLAARLESARIELEDIAFETRRYGDRVDMDPRRLEQVEERLDALKKLKRKHGLDLQAVLARAAELRAELAGFESLEDAVRQADEAVRAAEGQALEAAQALSEARVAAAGALEARVGEELDSLVMTGARIRFDLARGEALGPAGLDRGELLIQTNAGEEMRPLARIASGGELSRLLLALKRVLTHVDPVHTCIFDEMDTGVGGAVAEVIGQKMREIAAERQVVAITHLAQIAAQAHHHLQVEKRTVDGRTATRVRALDAGERTEEIARMLGGLQITERTREHAAELLALVH